MAWFQSRYDKVGPGGTGADYINCPLTSEQYDAFVDALLAGEKTDVQGLGDQHALFRRLPADRGDGRARPRDAAPRADEAGRPDQSARPDGQGLRRRAAAPGQHARHAVQHGRLPDQAEARRAGAHLPHHPGPRERRVRPARRPAPQHLPQLARSCSTASCGCKREPRLRFAGQITGCEGYVESAAIGLLAGRFAAAERRGADARAAAADHRASARCSATSPAATSRPSTPGRARSSR